MKHLFHVLSARIDLLLARSLLRLLNRAPLQEGNLLRLLPIEAGPPLVAAVVARAHIVLFLFLLDGLRPLHDDVLLVDFAPDGSIKEHSSFLFAISRGSKAGSFEHLIRANIEQLHKIELEPELKRNVFFLERTEGSAVLLFKLRSIEVVKVIEHDCQEQIQKNVLAEDLDHDKEDAVGVADCDHEAVHVVVPIVSDDKQEDCDESLLEVVEVRSRTRPIYEIHCSVCVEFTVICK